MNTHHPLLAAVISLTLAACGSQRAPRADAVEAPPPSPIVEAAPAAAAAAPAVLVSGTIEAPANLPAAQAVFVSLRAPGVPGPPLAAKRLPPGPFPLSFTVTEADRPMVNGPVPEAIEIKVTLDVDGNPMAKSAGDLEIVMPATRGASDVTLMLAPRAE